MHGLPPEIAAVESGKTFRLPDEGAREFTLVRYIIHGLPKCVLCKCTATSICCWQFDSWFYETCSLWAFPFSSTDNIDLVCFLV